MLLQTVSGSFAWQKLLFVDCNSELPDALLPSVFVRGKGFKIVILYYCLYISPTFVGLPRYIWWTLGPSFSGGKGFFAICFGAGWCAYILGAFFACGTLPPNLTTVLTTTGNRRAETGRERRPKHPEKGAKRGERSLKSDHRIFGTKRPWVRTPPLRPKKSVESCRFNALFGCYDVLGGEFDPNLTTIK